MTTQTLQELMIKQVERAFMLKPCRSLVLQYADGGVEVYQEREEQE